MARLRRDARGRARARLVAAVRAPRVVVVRRQYGHLRVVVVVLLIDGFEHLGGFSRSPHARDVPIHASDRCGRAAVAAGVAADAARRPEEGAVPRSIFTGDFIAVSRPFQAARPGLSGFLALAAALHGNEVVGAWASTRRIRQQSAQKQHEASSGSLKMRRSSPGRSVARGRRRAASNRDGPEKAIRKRHH